MKPDKKYIKIIVILLILGISGTAIFFLIKFIRSKMSITDQFKAALKKVVAKYGLDIASNVEKIFRLETANFTSGQFKGTFSPGMEKATNTYPFGWTSLGNSVWKENPQYAPHDFLPFTENATGKTKYFIKFPSLEASVMTIAQFLKNVNNNPGRWYSMEPDLQEEYAAKLSNIKPSLLNEIV